MPDLFGKPVPKPYVAPEPFYCYQCAGTNSKKCIDCGKRICLRHGSRCDSCDINNWHAKQQGKAEKHVSKLMSRLSIPGEAARDAGKGEGVGDG